LTKNILNILNGDFYAFPRFGFSYVTFQKSYFCLVLQTLAVLPPRKKERVNAS